MLQTQGRISLAAAALAGLALNFGWSGLSLLLAMATFGYLTMLLPWRNWFGHKLARPMDRLEPAAPADPAKPDPYAVLDVQPWPELIQSRKLQLDGLSKP